MPEIATRRPARGQGDGMAEGHAAGVPLHSAWRRPRTRRGGAGLGGGVCRASLPRAGSDSRATLWLGPDEYLLLAAGRGRSEQSSPGRWSGRLGELPHALVDIGHRQFALQVSGPHAADHSERRLPARSRPRRISRRHVHPDRFCQSRYRAVAYRRGRVSPRGMAFVRGYVTGLLNEIAREFYGGNKAGSAQTATPPGNAAHSLRRRGPQSTVRLIDCEARCAIGRSDFHTMKALSILGAGSGAGKSWITAALGAWLHGQGIRVAPFKAQNMSNNAWVTLDGGEIGRAQAVQAEACGLNPTVQMNPILLKPSGAHGSQVIVLGQSQGHCAGAEYYRRFDVLWKTVREVLDGWHERCDVLLLEGAGSPVELNLLQRDLVNLRPCHYLDGRWVFVGDIDRGGIFAQLAGHWSLFSPADRARGLGAIVNKFRGDISLFSNPQHWLEPHAPGFTVLGTLPYRAELQPEEEDGMSENDRVRGTGDVMAWIRFPHVSNLTDCQPWWSDAGVQVRWTADPRELLDARVIVLPGTKNTLADLRWLRSHRPGGRHRRGLRARHAHHRSVRRLSNARRDSHRRIGPCRGFGLGARSSIAPGRNAVQSSQDAAPGHCAMRRQRMAGL